MSNAKTIDYGKTFNSLCHFMALSQTVNINDVLDNLVVSAIALEKLTGSISIVEIKDALEVYFSTEVTEHDLQDSLSRLASKNKLLVQSDGLFRLQSKTFTEVNARTKAAEELEDRVKEEWLREVRKTGQKSEVEQTSDLSSLWSVLQSYLAKSFYRHGAQTIQIFDPTFEIPEAATVRLSSLLQEAIEENKSPLPKAFVKDCIRGFLSNRTPDRVSYLAELLDGTFTFFALNVDGAISEYLAGEFQPLSIFLDTNFIFSILELHNNSLVEVSHELIEIISKYFPQITLYYHIATVEEMQRTIDALGEHLTKRKWKPSISRAGFNSGQLTGLELKFHQENANSQIQLDPKIFVAKYQNPVRILTEKGFKIYESPLQTDIQVKGALIADYKSFIESRRKPKSYRAYDHDMVVLLAAEENRSISNKYSVLEAGSLILTCDYYLYLFDHYKHKNGKVGSVVLPNHLLQMLRPLIPKNSSFDERFVATFAIPEFRSIDSDYSETITKVLMYLASFKDISEESAARILGDVALIQSLSGVDENSEEFVHSIEHALAQENEELLEEVVSLRTELTEVQALAEKRDQELHEEKKRSEELERITGEKQNAIREVELQYAELAQEKMNLQKSAEQALTQKTLEHQQALKTIKNNLDLEAQKYARKRLLGFVGIMLATSAILLIATEYFGWDRLEPVAWALSPTLIAGSYLYYAIKQKEWSPRSLYEQWIDKKKQQFYRTYGVDLESIDNR